MLIIQSTNIYCPEQSAYSPYITGITCTMRFCDHIAQVTLFMLQLAVCTKLLTVLYTILLLSDIHEVVQRQVVHYGTPRIIYSDQAAGIACLW